MPCHRRDICTASLHCVSSRAEQDCTPRWIVCRKHYTQTVSLLNDFGCVLLDDCYCDNICHTLCTCIYQREYSCADCGRPGMKNVYRIACTDTTFLQCAFFGEHSEAFCLWTVCHTQYTNTALACHHVDAQCDHCYQLQSLLQPNFHLHNMRQY